MRAMAAVSVLTGVSVNVISSMSSASGSSSSSFGMMNQLQMIIILPLFGSYIPSKVMDFLKSMSDSMFTFGFLPTTDNVVVVWITDTFSFPQSNVFLYLLGLESGSAIVNVTNLIVAVFSLSVIHVLLWFLYMILKYVFKLEWIPGKRGSSFHH